MNLRKILVAVDFSTDSERAIDAAVELATGNEGSLTLLHVYETPAFSTPDLGMYIPAPELTADIIAQARRGLDERRARCADKGVSVDVAWVAGAPAAEIVRYASAHDFGLIVVGSHGRRGFRRFVLGSVAEMVVRTADRPVLTVHPHATESAVAAAGAP
ncbi:MAG: UspA domain protein [Myxococcales bacterium]|nr:UspA domain protein [Myxococcales bacterium]